MAIRLDPTNSAIQDIRSLERPGEATVLQSAGDLAHLGPPSEAEVLRALQEGPREVPAILKVSLDDLQVLTEPLDGQVDSPRSFPLVGQAELHHCHWKCTAYYSESVESGDLFPARVKRPRVRVV